MPRKITTMAGSWKSPTTLYKVFSCNIYVGRPGKYVINFKEAMIQANYNKMEQF